jgi:hypothetical protein
MASTNDYLDGEYIYGPQSNGRYYIDNGYIYGPGSNGEFYLEDGYFYGPQGKKLPWVN